MTDETLPRRDLAPYKEQLREMSREFARAVDMDPNIFLSPRERIEAEIEERRPRIRRAAALAEALVRAAQGERIDPAERRPKTVAGIAVLRAERLQRRRFAEITAEIR